MREKPQKLCYGGSGYVIEGGPRPSARVGGNYGQAEGKLGEGRAGAPGDQALLRRAALCYNG